MKTMRQIIMSSVAVIALAGTASAVQEHHQANPDAATQLAQQTDMTGQGAMPMTQQPQTGAGTMNQGGMGMPCMTGQGMMGQGGMGMTGPGMMGQGGMGMPCMMGPGMMGPGMMGQGGMGMMGPGMMGQGGMGMPCMMGPGMMGQGGMGMMSPGMMGQGGMGMMGPGMMGQGGMGMMGPGMMGQAPTTDAGAADTMTQLMADRVEGRIAFLRAELKITDQQKAQWDAFAEALRANAKSMMEARAAAMGAGAAQTVLDRLDRQEKMMSARLAGISAVKSTLASLYGVLSAEQKKTADELLAHPMFFGRMAMGAP